MDNKNVKQAFFESMVKSTSPDVFLEYMFGDANKLSYMAHQKPCGEYVVYVEINDPEFEALLENGGGINELG